MEYCCRHKILCQYYLRLFSLIVRVKFIIILEEIGHERFLMEINQGKRTKVRYADIETDDVVVFPTKYILSDDEEDKVDEADTK